jgi:uncharacterized membrane protein YkvA (DUF1232 family)
MLATLKTRAKALKREIHALYLAARDPRTPWYAKVMIGCVVAYALSPIDLIPDFIPVLGYLDDLLLLPLGIYLALKLIPAEVLTDARRRAAASTATLTKSRSAAWVIILLWIFALAAVAILIARYYDGDTQALIGA